MFCTRRILIYRKRCIALAPRFSGYDIRCSGNDATTYWQSFWCIHKRYLCHWPEGPHARNGGRLPFWVHRRRFFFKTTIPWSIICGVSSIRWRTSHSPDWHVVRSRSFRYHSFLAVWKDKSSWDRTLTVIYCIGQKKCEISSDKLSFFQEMLLTSLTLSSTFRPTKLLSSLIRITKNAMNNFETIIGFQEPDCGICEL